MPSTTSIAATGLLWPAGPVSSSLQPFTATHLAFLEQLTQSIGVVLNTIEATMRTESLLRQSQQLTLQLQTRQSELQQTNEELASKAKQLAEQNVEVERKNKEVEQARRALEDQAAELSRRAAAAGLVGPGGGTIPRPCRRRHRCHRASHRPRAGAFLRLIHPNR